MTGHNFFFWWSLELRVCVAGAWNCAVLCITLISCAGVAWRGVAWRSRSRLWIPVKRNLYQRFLNDTVLCSDLLR